MQVFLSLQLALFPTNALLNRMHQVQTMVADMVFRLICLTKAPKSEYRDSENKKRLYRT